MKVLVVGSGGREQALAWRFAIEGAEVLVAPGNAGTPICADVQAGDVEGLLALAERERVNLTVVGPEAPLAAGLVDRFEQRGLTAFGPTQAAAQLEWSKAWAKEFLRRHSIPTGRAEVVYSHAEAKRTLSRFGLPVVLKADGLAGGKGVFVAYTPAGLEEAVDQLFTRRTVGAAADVVLVEEYLEGPELSVLAVTDGERLAIMPPARDYKRLLDDDRGPNTGGMGGMTYPSYATASLMDDVAQRILRPTLDGMHAEGRPYRGILFAGLILTTDGPKVLEFNCRFGDPECQLILPLFGGSLIHACASAAAGALDTRAISRRESRTYGVVLATAGYPEAPIVGDPIEGLDEIPHGVIAFHAGTRRDGGRLVTGGGRVLTLVGTERDAVYRAAEVVHFKGKQYRTDIGVEAMSVAGARA